MENGQKQAETATNSRNAAAAVATQFPLTRVRCQGATVWKQEATTDTVTKDS